MKNLRPMFLVLTVLLFCRIPQAPAQENHQKIYPIDSEVYQALKTLYLSQGLALPSTSGPWSEDELLLMLDRLNPDALQEGAQRAYDFAGEELSRKHSVFNFQGHVSLEAYAHTDTEHFVTEDFYVRDWDDSRPLLKLEFEGFVTPWFYGYSHFNLANAIYTVAAENPYTTFPTDVGTSGWRATSGTLDPKYAGSLGSRLFGKTAVSTNFQELYLGLIDDTDFSFPQRAFISAGGHGWNIEFGRERYSWGPGESGNFLVGDQVNYHTGGRLSAYANNFKYSFTVSSFTPPAEYYQRLDDGVGYLPVGPYHWGTDEYKGVQLFIAHRIEARVLSDRLGFALNEAIMYQDDSLGIPLEVLNPLLLLHNSYRNKVMNSILTFEADFALMPRVNLYAQLVVDEFTMPGEAKPGTKPNTSPTAFGYMLGAKTAMPLRNGMFSASLEGVLTDPYLYLRHKPSGDGNTVDATQTHNQKLNDPGLGFVVANRYHTYFGFMYKEDFLGYRYGGDAIVVNANAAYREFGWWNVGANLMFMAHGAFDKWTVYTKTLGTQPSTPTSGHPAENTPDTGYGGNNADTTASTRNAVSFTTALSLMGSWNIFHDVPWIKNLAVFGQTDLVIIVNPGNRKENKPVTDLQVSLGVTYSF
jgi:hypothetical protein